ncbi:hypothetical protein MASR2M79_10740 [Aminivibrio sp.]
MQWTRSGYPPGTGIFSFSDEIVHLTGVGMQGKYPGPLRRITVENLEKGE